MPNHREVVRVGLVPRMGVAIEKDERQFGEESGERVARKHEHRSADEREGHREKDGEELGKPAEQDGLGKGPIDGGVVVGRQWLFHDGTFESGEECIADFGSGHDENAAHTKPDGKAEGTAVTLGHAESEK